MNPAHTPESLETQAIQDAIDQAHHNSGGTVTLNSGIHLTGALRLRSNVELHLESGAVLRFVPDSELYPLVEARWEGAPATIHQPCIWAKDATNIAITGFGTIDGQGAPWWDLYRNHRDQLTNPRPTLLGLHSCLHVTLRDITLTNSPAWTVHPLWCDGVTIDNLRIVNPADSPNTDGIDPESSRNIRISNCTIDVGDDCIAIKAGSERSPERIPCENLSITGCTILHGHGGVVLGSEMSGGVRNVVISNCVFEGTDRGIRWKSRRGRGGVIEDIRVSNIIMRDVMCPLVANPFYFCGPDGRLPQVADRNPYPVGDTTPLFRRIQISHITARDVRAAAGYLYGLPEAPMSELVLDDVAISFADDAEPEVPAMAECVPPMLRAGLQLGFTDSAVLNNVRLTGCDGQLLVTESCTGTTGEVAGA